MCGERLKKQGPEVDPAVCLCHTLRAVAVTCSQRGGNHSFLLTQPLVLTESVQQRPDRLAHGLGQVGTWREVPGQELEKRNAPDTGVGGWRRQPWRCAGSGSALLSQGRTVPQVVSLRHSRALSNWPRSHPLAHQVLPSGKSPRWGSSLLRPDPLVPYCG